MRVVYQPTWEDKKALRSEKVAGIIVEVVRADGTVLRFDGDETSQGRLKRFAERARETGRASIPWKLADNTTANVTPEEMLQALDQALAAQGALWFV